MRARKHAPWRAQAVFTAQEEPEMAERAFGSALELEPDNGQAWKGMSDPNPSPKGNPNPNPNSQRTLTHET